MCVCVVMHRAFPYNIMFYITTGAFVITGVGNGILSFGKYVQACIYMYMY